jgi:hypothetical protein
MSTIQKSCPKSCWCWRTISRKRRRTRLRITALPKRREVTKPTRHNPEFSTTVALSVSSLPRRAKPSRLTRSYSDARVKRRDFEKENERPMDVIDFDLATVRRESPTARFQLRKFSRPDHRHSTYPCTTKVFPGEISGEDFAKRSKPSILRTGRRLGRRFRGCSGRFCCYSGRFCCRRRAGCFSYCWCARRRWTCRGFGCLGFLLARRKERGTGQNADVFFHSVNRKRHIALTD